tara:strand:+ start:988 stop:1365 length:378 start_codon:yes stop_codon:yes gene_type:complete
MLDFINSVKFNSSGLIPSIAQDFKSKKVLMLAWMSRESLLKTLETGSVVYFSRSRNCLWHKGETSGQYQVVKEIYLDCDSDAILLFVEQMKGIACHTGRPSCFFRKLGKNGWSITEIEKSTRSKK